MSIEELKEIVSPPETPVFVETNSSVHQFKETVGTELPHDYIEFCKNYGSGVIDPLEIVVFNPFDPKYLQQQRVSSMQLESQEELNELADYKVFPQEGGLLGWAKNSNGHNFCWHTNGEPDHWPVVIAFHGGGTQAFEMKSCEFLVKLLRGDIKYEGQGKASGEIGFRANRKRS